MRTTWEGVGVSPFSKPHLIDGVYAAGSGRCRRCAAAAAAAAGRAVLRATKRRKQVLRMATPPPARPAQQAHSDSLSGERAKAATPHHR